MFRPISTKIMKSTVTVKVCCGVDTWRNQLYETYQVEKVFMQPGQRIVKTVNGTERQIHGLLFVDPQISTPALNWKALLDKAQKAGGDMRVILRDVEYTVLTVDACRDFGDLFHHWEIGVE